MLLDDLLIGRERPFAIAGLDQCPTFEIEQERDVLRLGSRQSRIDGGDRRREIARLQSQLNVGREAGDERRQRTDLDGFTLASRVGDQCIVEFIVGEELGWGMRTRCSTRSTEPTV